MAYHNYYSFLFKIIKAPITPEIHPNKVRMKTIEIDPQPRSITANGENIIHGVLEWFCTEIIEISIY